MRGGAWIAALKALRHPKTECAEIKNTKIKNTKARAGLRPAAVPTRFAARGRAAGGASRQRQNDRGEGVVDARTKKGEAAHERENCYEKRTEEGRGVPQALKRGHISTT